MNESNKSLINQILVLLDSMERGFFYNREKLQRLDSKESIDTLEDIKDALISIDKSLEPLEGEIDLGDIRSKYRNMKDELNSVISEYRDNDGKGSSDLIDLWLTPSFRSWKSEIEETLRTYIR